MKAMKTMKAMKASGSMTASGAYSAVAETTGLKAKDVKACVEGLVAVAAEELKKSGSFKMAGALNLMLKCFAYVLAVVFMKCLLSFRTM